MPNEETQPFREAMDSYRSMAEPKLEQYKKALQDPRVRADENLTRKFAESALAIKNELQQRQSQYEGALLKNQARIFSELQEPSGAGFEEVKSTSYVPTYGMPGMKSSYDRSSWKRGKETDKTIQKKLAEALNVDPAFVSTKKNLDQSTTTAIRSLGTPEEKAQWLTGLADIEEVHPIRIAGEDNFLIKDISTGVRRGDDDVARNETYYLAFKPGGDKAKKFTAGAVTEIPRIGGAILSAMSGGKAKAGVANKAASLTGASLRGSGAYEGIEYAQEGLMRTVGGMEADRGERLKESGVDTGVGLLIDYGTAGIGRIGAKRVGQPLISDAQKGFQGAKETIEKKTGEVLDDIPHISGSAASREAWSSLERFKSSSFARQMKRTREALARVQKGLMGEGSTPEQRKALVDAAKEEYDTIANDLAKAKSRGAQYGDAAVKRAVERRKQALELGPTPNRKALGEQLVEQVDSARETGRQMRDKAFGDFFQQADQAGVTMNRAQVADELDEILKQPGNRAAQNTRVHEIVDRLRADAADAPVMGLQEYRGYISEISDSTGVKAIGAKTPQKIAQAADTKARELMLSKIKGTPLEDSWSQAVKVYDEAALAFNRSSPGRILAETMGDTRISHEGAVKALLQNSKNLDDYMAAMYATGNGAQAEATRKQLQAAFLEGGITDAQLIEKKPLVEMLWARNADGTIDAAKAQRVTQALEDLNRLEKLKVDMTKITPQQVDELSGYIGQKQRDKMLGLIATRDAAEKAEKKILDNAIIAKAKKDGWDYAQKDDLARALWGSKKKDIDQVFNSSKLSPSDKAALRQDMRNQFFNEFSGGPEASPGELLFDANKIMKKVGNWKGRGKGPTPELVQKLDAIGDKETTDLIMAVARAQKEAVPDAIISSKEAMVRGQLNQQGIVVYGTGVPKTVKDMALAHAYGTPGFKSILRMKLKNVDPRVVEQNMDKLYKGVVSTRLGMQHAIRRSGQDPEFAEDFQNMLAEIAREEAAK